MSDRHFTHKQDTFPGSIRSLFSVTKLRGLFAFIGKKLCPPKTIIINNHIISSNAPKEDIDKMLKQLYRGIEEAAKRGLLND